MGNPTTERELHHANVSNSHHVVDANDTTQHNISQIQITPNCLLTYYWQSQCPTNILTLALLEWGSMLDYLIVLG